MKERLTLTWILILVLSMPSTVMTMALYREQMGVVLAWAKSCLQNAKEKHGLYCFQWERALSIHWAPSMWLILNNVSGFAYILSLAHAHFTKVESKGQSDLLRDTAGVSETGFTLDLYILTSEQFPLTFCFLLNEGLTLSFLVTCD